MTSLSKGRALGTHFIDSARHASISTFLMVVAIFVRCHALSPKASRLPRGRRRLETVRSSRTIVFYDGEMYKICLKFARNFRQKFGAWPEIQPFPDFFLGSRARTHFALSAHTLRKKPVCASRACSLNSASLFSNVSTNASNFST